MAKRKKKFPVVALKSTAPAISVIIPMYNAEAFIGECLDSILLQTFQDFEIIVVDDCSTDNSVAIVESYREKFGERLIISKTEKNSGGGGYVSRNIGLELASGEYVYFVDSDDLVLLTALETLYAAAKEYDADVVYTACYYWMSSSQEVSVKPDEIGIKLLEDGLEDAPTLIVDDQNKILKEALLRKHHRTPWAKFIRRTLLTENKILFPEIIIGGDSLWTFRVYSHSKRFLRLPTALYFLRRYNLDSVVKTKRPSSKVEFDPLANLGYIKWFEEFKSLAGQIEFLKENLDICSQVAKDYFDYFGIRLKEKYKQKYIDDLFYILQHELPDDFTARFLNLLKPEQDLTQFQPIKSTCAVSVIISLYNYEKYVGECLDSLLAQTFKNFEVIVVDDCSTDNSFEVAESYTEKFGGRLKLVQTETNSGGGGEPRNLGFSLASGEYVFFMDADDVLISTALEEFYAFAKNNYADVVYCEKYFTSEGVGQDFINNMRIADIKCQKSPFVNEPTFETLSMTRRIDRAVRFKYWVTAWLRFVRRDLLIENDIKFLSLIGSNDVGWSYQVLFCSKRFLRIPNIYYVRRVHDESVSFRKRKVPELVHKWMDRTIRSLRYMDDFMGKFAFFREHLDYRYKVLSHFMTTDFDHITEECEDLEPFEVAKIFRQKFGDYLGEHDVLVSCLCAELVSKYTRIKHDKQRIFQLKERIINYQAKNTLAISVIIPMYNAENYIGECLNSLLLQTFRKFEVIVVDDRSTDNSVEIVKSYMPKFKGKLKLAKTRKNSGGGGYVPRNMGLNLASGEYVFFVDADDFILLTALETLHRAAIEFDADVVCTNAYYNLIGKNEVRKVTDDTEKNLFAGDPEGNPNLLINSPNKNMQSLLFAETMPASWRKFVRRKFLIDNQIFFPEVLNGGDFIWTINLYCSAKRLLRIPSALYFYRSYTPNSILRKKRKPADQIFYRVSSFISWSRAFGELSQKNAILKKNPEYCHRALSLKFSWCLGRLLTDLNQLYYKDIYEVLCKELSKGTNPSDLTTMAFIFSGIVLEKRNYAALEQRVAELESELTTLKGKE